MNGGRAALGNDGELRGFVGADPRGQRVRHQDAAGPAPWPHWVFTFHKVCVVLETFAVVEWNWKPLLVALWLLGIGCFLVVRRIAL